MESCRALNARLGSLPSCDSAGSGLAVAKAAGAKGDRVCCLEAGKVISEGGPVAVRNDPLVIASYLGTD